MGILSDLLGGIAGDLYGGIPSEVTDIYTEPLTELASPDITFQPFTVTGGGGTITAGPTGTSYALSGSGQQLQSALESEALDRFGSAPMSLGQIGSAAEQALGVGGQFMGQVGMPMGAREQEVYDRIRATQLAEEERQRLALEERLSNQGRLGVRTAMFGGTPEQLALAQAQEEAKNRAALAAIQQAQAEQQQQAAIGSQFTELGGGLFSQQKAIDAAQQQMGLSALEGAYIPQAAMLSAFSPAINIASLEDVARRQQGEFDYQTQLANLQGAVGQSQGLADLYAGMFTGAGGLLSGLTSAVPGTLDAIASIKEAFS
tara:strand:- start:8207 stop:9157 length:951 start_codon:yes stop_codon:yes gene_type:complete